jgi:D-alanyl-D-alanine carboxypeptidase
MKDYKPMSESLFRLPYRFAIILGILSILIFSWGVALSQADERGSKIRQTHNKYANKKIEKKKCHLKKVTKRQTTKRNDKKKVKQPPKGIQAKAFFCENLAGNRTLLARDPDKQLPVASLTKLVTALVTLDKMPLNQKVTIPDSIKSVPKSVVGLKAGDQVTVGDLLHGLLINSGNDCAEALACAYPGGRDKFIEMMNEKVRSLGTRSTRFYTPSGLDQKVEHPAEGKKMGDVASNVSTAREIAEIARAAFSNKIIREISRKRTHVMASAMEKNGYSVKNTNKLLRDDLPLVGGKTGYTAKAGHCLATAFTPGRNIFMIVVLGSPDHFRDTRLVYRKALKEATRIQLPSSVRDPRRVATRIEQNHH